VGTFRDLIAWQKAMQLVSTIYQETERLPKHETYGLSTQIRRAAVSVPSNIAEGQARHSRKEFLYFLSTARGSLAELQTQILIAGNPGYLPASESKRIVEQADECRLVNKLCSSLQPTTINEELPRDIKEAIPGILATKN